MGDLNVADVERLFLEERGGVGVGGHGVGAEDDLVRVVQVAGALRAFGEKDARGVDDDELGLDELDRSFLRALAGVYEGGPAGIEAIAATLGEEKDTLEDVVEPYLLQLGFLDRTPQGRVATKSAYEHLGYTYTEQGQARLL